MSNSPGRALSIPAAWDAAFRFVPWLWCVMFLVLVQPTAQVHAEETVERMTARRLFEQGVTAAANRDWAVAADLFEASLRHAEHPAARSNLVLAYVELGRALNVVRHAWAFLDLPATESRPEVRAQVRALLDSAAAALAIVDRREVPADSELLIDEHPPAIVHGSELYVAPGMHVLETRRLGTSVHRVELALSAGQIRLWPVPAASPGPTASALEARAAPVTPNLNHDVARPSDLLAQRISWGLAGAGGSTGVVAVALYAIAKVQATRISHRGPSYLGYPGDADRYGRLKLAVMPIAIGSGLLLAGAAALSPNLTKRGALGLEVASLVVGGAIAGLAGFWMAREPRGLIEGTAVREPTLAAGTLWLGASLPLLAFGASKLISRAAGYSGRAVRAHAIRGR